VRGSARCFARAGSGSGGTERSDRRPPVAPVAGGRGRGRAVPGALCVVRRASAECECGVRVRSASAECLVVSSACGVSVFSRRPVADRGLDPADCSVTGDPHRRQPVALAAGGRGRRKSGAGCAVRDASCGCGVPGARCGVPRVKTSTRRSALAPAHWVCRGGRGRRKSGARCAVRGAWCECGVPGGQCDVRRVSLQPASGGGPGFGSGRL
jgi:hypothetical protein